tara:strand:+ start:122 stop:583 length:462 start_codon:yes stop_codon:yes gene_type:complete
MVFREFQKKLIIRMDISNSLLKVIHTKKGLLRKVLDKNDKNFFGFGEAYISEINFNEVKGWKKHRNKISNFVVVHGTVKFVAWHPKKPTIFESFILNVSNKDNQYSRLCIRENIWFAFKGMENPVSRILNISNICNEDVVSDSLDIDSVKYIW